MPVDDEALLLKVKGHRLIRYDDPRETIPIPRPVQLLLLLLLRPALLLLLLPNLPYEADGVDRVCPCHHRHRRPKKSINILLLLLRSSRRRW